MAEKHYVPDFKYSGNQILLSSGKVTLHSSDDSIMLFGKKAIALSSLGTVNFDVSQRVLINAPKIELGLAAEKFGEPVLLGKKTVELLARLIDQLTVLGASLSQLNESDLAKTIPEVVKSSSGVAKTLPSLRADLLGLLSTVTYTN